MIEIRQKGNVEHTSISLNFTLHLVAGLTKQKDWYAKHSTKEFNVWLFVGTQIGTRLVCPRSGLRTEKAFMCNKINSFCYINIFGHSIGTFYAWYDHVASCMPSRRSTLLVVFLWRWPSIPLFSIVAGVLENVFKYAFFNGCLTIIQVELRKSCTFIFIRATVLILTETFLRWHYVLLMRRMLFSATSVCDVAPIFISNLENLVCSPQPVCVRCRYCFSNSIQTNLLNVVIRREVQAEFSESRIWE